MQCSEVKYSRLSLSRSPRDSLKYFKISIPRHIRFVKLRKTINQTTTFNKWICNLTSEVKGYIENIVEKRRNCSLGAIPPLFHNILIPLLDFYVRTGTRFSLRDKRLLEISVVEITRVDCTKLKGCLWKQRTHKSCLLEKAQCDLCNSHPCQPQWLSWMLVRLVIRRLQVRPPIVSRKTHLYNFDPLKPHFYI